MHQHFLVASPSRLLADAFELVGRTDDTLQAKTNPFEMATFTDEDLLAAERTASQGHLEDVSAEEIGRRAAEVSATG